MDRNLPVDTLLSGHLSSRDQFNSSKTNKSTVSYRKKFGKKSKHSPYYQRRNQNDTVVKGGDFSNSKVRQDQVDFEPIASKISIKSYCWSDNSIEIESNHIFSNLSLRARAAQLPLKDGVHMRFHTIHNKDRGSPQDVYRVETIGEIPKLQLLDDPLTRNKLSQIELDSDLTEKEFRVASSENILDWATQSKSSSLMLQNFVEGCSEVSLVKMVQFIGVNIGSLVSHKYGSYLLQKMIVRDPNVLEGVSSYCKAHFLELANNEFSSRIMQRLIEQSQDFRKYSMSCFKLNLEPYLQCVAAGFLVSSGIVRSQSELERDIISDYLRSNPSTWIENKYFKKIVVTYLDKCSEEKMNAFFVLLNIEDSILSYLQDKHSCFILLKFLERGHIETTTLLINSIKNRPMEAIRLKFFGYFVGQLLKKDEVRDLAFKISLILRSLSQENFRQLMKETVMYQVYSGALSVVALIGEQRTIEQSVRSQ